MIKQILTYEALKSQGLQELSTVLIINKHMITLFPILISGFRGGATRGLIGYLKHQYSYKNVGFDLRYFTVMMFLSGIVGVLTAVAIDQSTISVEGITYVAPAIAFIIGYAGGDFLDGVYKILLKKVK